MGVQKETSSLDKIEKKSKEEKMDEVYLCVSTKERGLAGKRGLETDPFKRTHYGASS